MNDTWLEQLYRQVQKLEERVALLEMRAHPIPWLYEHTCNKCGRKYQTGGAIACGALPRCPHCLTYQGGAWESFCSGNAPSGSGGEWGRDIKGMNI